MQIIIAQKLQAKLNKANKQIYQYYYQLECRKSYSVHPVRHFPDSRIEEKDDTFPASDLLDHEANRKIWQKIVNTRKKIKQHKADLSCVLSDPYKSKLKV